MNNYNELFWVELLSTQILPLNKCSNVTFVYVPQK